MWRPGDRIGSYRIVERLRSGGMATLFLGRRLGAAGFARPVAIKVVHPHLARDRAFVRMFIEEAKLSAAIDHPNVVHVDELGRSGGTYFLVMEYVQGASLHQLQRALGRLRRRMRPEMAVWIAMQLADGLHAAHETRGEDGLALGVVHRDVSPQNVLLSHRGSVKLIDFGIAKASSRTQDTAAGTLKGKLRYMAPEQAYGRAVDRRADVYALGIVLWEMLTERRLFHADSDLALIDLVRHPDVLPPGRFADGIPPALDRVVMAALAPEANDRIATAAELRDQLAMALPEALTVAPTALAELLSATLHERIARERRRGGDDHEPTPATGVMPDDERVLTQRTRVDEGVEADDDDDSETGWPGDDAPARVPRTAWLAWAALVLLAVGGSLAMVARRPRPQVALATVHQVPVLRPPAASEPTVDVPTPVPDASVATTTRPDVTIPPHRRRHGSHIRPRHDGVPIEDTPRF